MSKRKNYKSIQYNFKTKKEYEKFHNQAVKNTKTDTRMTDCMYIRECITNNSRQKAATNKKRALAFVNGQQQMVELIQFTDDKELKTKIMEMSKEVSDIWVC